MGSLQRPLFQVCEVRAQAQLAFGPVLALTRGAVLHGSSGHGADIVHVDASTSTSAAGSDGEHLRDDTRRFEADAGLR